MEWPSIGKFYWTLIKCIREGVNEIYRVILFKTFAFNCFWLYFAWNKLLDPPPQKKNFFNWGRGGGQVVSVLAFYSDEPSSNPADTYSFFFVFEKRYINFKKVL